MLEPGVIESAIELYLNLLTAGRTFPAAASIRKRLLHQQRKTLLQDTTTSPFAHGDAKGRLAALHAATPASSSSLQKELD